MAIRMASGLLALLLCQTGCVLVAGPRGISVRLPSLISLCGPRPSSQVIEELVRAECGGVAGLQIKCATPIRRQVIDSVGRTIHGWYVTATVLASSPHPLVNLQVQEHRYILQKRDHGYAIVAHTIGSNVVGSTQMTWLQRDLVTIDKQLTLLHTQREMQHRLDEQRRKIAEQKDWITKQAERERERLKKLQGERERERHQAEVERVARKQQQLNERKLAERSRDWKVMTKRPTDGERQAADHGPRPKHAKQTVSLRLAKILNDSDQSDIKIYEPSKTWGRVLGTSELVWGWGVRVRVRVKKKDERPESKFYNFMFRGETIISTELEGLGYTLSARPPK